MTACSCAEAGATQLDMLDELVNTHGVDQYEASHRLWVLGHADLTEAGRDAVRIVREGLADVLAWLHAAGVKA